MRTIVTRVWTFRYAAVNRRWVANCATCTSPHRDQLERLADGTPLLARGRGFHNRLLSAIPGADGELTAAGIGRHFAQKHFPLRAMAQVRGVMAEEAGSLARRTGRTFDDALSEIKAGRLVQHQADLNRYMAGPPDDLSHLRHPRPLAVKRNRSTQDAARPSALIRREWGAKQDFGPGFVYRLAGIEPPPDPEPESHESSFFGLLRQVTPITDPE